MDDVTNLATPDEQQFDRTPPFVASPAQNTAGASNGEVQAAQEQHHNMVGKIYHAVLNTLGGTNDVSYSRDANGKLVQTQTPKTPGQQWKTIIAGAMTGLAAGATAKKTNPGAPALTGAGAGFNAVREQNIETDTRKRGQANEDFEAQQKTTLGKAQVAMMTQQTTASAWKLSREQVDAKFQDSERENAFMKAISLDSGNRDLGVARSVDDLMQMHKEMPDLLQQQAHGNIYGIPHISAEGKIDGMRYALVNPDWKEKRIGEDQTLYRLTPPQKAGDPPVVDRQTVKAGTMTNGEFFNAQQATNAQFIQYYENQNAQTQENKRLAIREAGENTRAAAKEKGEMDRAKLQYGDGSLTVDAFGNKVGITPEGSRLPLKEFNGRADKFSKEYVQPLNVLQKTTMEFDRINSNPKQTGAEKVTALLNAVGISGDPLKGKGFRITNDIIKEHAGARNIWESGVQKLNTIAGTGGPITSKQIADYTAVAQGVVHDAYVTAAQEAKRQGLPVNFLPKATGQNQKASDLILKIYVDSAGGDLDAAEKALRAGGWN